MFVCVCVSARSCVCDGRVGYMLLELGSLNDSLANIPFRLLAVRPFVRCFAFALQFFVLFVFVVLIKKRKNSARIDATLQYASSYT